MSPTPNLRPIEPGTYEIRLESFGNTFGYDTVEVLPGYSTDDGPSQSATDAARDGVVLSVAELSIADRVGTLVWADSAEGLWVLSRRFRSGEVVLSGACEPENPDCVYGRDYAFVPEYAEVLLMDPTGAEILRAYPMPGLVPSWLAVGADAVYTGRIGDGGLPDSSVVRIDRETLELAGMVFAAELDGPSQVVTAIREGRSAERLVGIWRARAGPAGSDDGQQLDCGGEGRGRPGSVRCGSTSMASMPCSALARTPVQQRVGVGGCRRCSGRDGERLRCYQEAVDAEALHSDEQRREPATPISSSS